MIFFFPESTIRVVFNYKKLHIVYKTAFIYDKKLNITYKDNLAFLDSILWSCIDFLHENPSPRGCNFRNILGIVAEIKDIWNDEIAKCQQ